MFVLLKQALHTGNKSKNGYFLSENGLIKVQTGSLRTIHVLRDLQLEDGCSCQKKKTNFTNEEIRKVLELYNDNKEVLNSKLKSNVTAKQKKRNMG